MKNPVCGRGYLGQVSHIYNFTNLDEIRNGVRGIQIRANLVSSSATCRLYQILEAALSIVRTGELLYKLRMSPIERIFLGAIITHILFDKPSQKIMTPTRL